MAKPQLDPKREFVSGGTNAFVSALKEQALPLAFDDATRDFGSDLYDRMMRDPACSSSIETLKAMMLAEEPRIVGAVADADDPDWKRSEELREFVASCISGCETSVTTALWEMCDGLWRGSYVAEKVLRAESGKLVLDRFKPKHPQRTAFVCDRHMNVIGIGLRDVEFYKDLAEIPRVDGLPVLERERFAVLTFFGIGGDPRGTSLLRPAYNSWWIRQQVWAPFLKYLVQWATPSLVGFTPEGALDSSDIDDGDTIDDDNTVTPEEAMVAALTLFQGGTALGLKGGSKLDVIQSTGDGDAFIKALDTLAREIVTAILRVTRATMESQHGSKADSQTAQDVLNVFVAFLRRVVETMMDRDVVRWLVDLNFGKEALKLAPSFKLTAVEKEDVAAVVDAVAKLWSADFFDESQVQELDQKLGMPERDYEAWMLRRQDAADARRMDAAGLTKLQDPGAEEVDVTEAQ